MNIGDGEEGKREERREKRKGDRRGKEEERVGGREGGSGEEMKEERKGRREEGREKRKKEERERVEEGGSMLIMEYTKLLKANAAPSDVYIYKLRTCIYSRQHTETKVTQQMTLLLYCSLPFVIFIHFSIGPAIQCPINKLLLFQQASL